MTSSPLHVNDTRGYAQGEIFLLTRNDQGFSALVYNTTGFGPCPESEFEAIDVEALAVETASDAVWKNPRRFWMMDDLTIALAGEPAEFGGIRFNFAATIQFPPNFTPEAGGQAAMTYRPAEIQRVTRYEFKAARPVFLLRSPDNVTYVMQTYTTHKASDLTEADLPDLGHRLALADGWQFKATTLDRDLILDTNGLAHIVADDLEDMYQGCTPDVANFDPWGTA